MASITITPPATPTAPTITVRVTLGVPFTAPTPAAATTKAAVLNLKKYGLRLLVAGQSTIHEFNFEPAEAPAYYDFQNVAVTAGQVFLVAYLIDTKQNHDPADDTVEAKDAIVIMVAPPAGGSAG